MPDEPARRPILALAALGWTLASIFVLALALHFTEALRPGAENDIINIVACRVLAASVIVFAMVRVHARDSSLRLALGLRPIGPLAVALSAAAGAGLHPLISTIEDRIVLNWPYPSEEVAFDKVVAAQVAQSRVAVVIALFVVAPLVTEVLFRGILFTQLRRVGSAFFASVATALLFAAYSVDPRVVPTSIVVGLAFARLRTRTGTVLAPIVASVAFMAVPGLPVLRGRDLLAALTVVYPTRWVIGGAVVAALALIVIGAGRKAPE